MAEQNIPVLQEHQSVEANTTSPTGYTPSADEKKAIALVERLFQKAKAHRKRYDESWPDYYKMFRGKQWKEQRPSYRHSEVINMIFQSIQSTVPIQTDARPKIEFLPQDPADREFADIMNEVCQADWESKNWLMTLTEVIYDSNFYGAGLSGCDFDHEANLGVGDISYESEDPLHCYPDPNAQDVNKKSRFFILAKPVDLAEMKRQYPEKGKFVKSDVMDLVRDNKHDLDETHYKSPIDNKTVIEGSSPYDLGQKDQALKITCYLLSDDYDEEKKEEIDPVTGQVVKTEFIQKLKYPRGRKICVAGGVVLEDDHNPFEDGKFPYSRLLNYVLPREFWGISEVEQLQSPQKIFNKLISFALDVLTLMGNPIWVVDNDSGIDTDNLVNRPGLVVEKNKGSEARREEGVQLQPYVLQMADMVRGWFDGVSGANDVTRGVRPEGVTAASAISSLQEAAQTRLRLKSRNLDAYLQDFGQQYLSRVLQYRTAPQIYRLTNNENAQKYFRFYVKNDEAGNKYAVVQPFNQDPATGKLLEGTPNEYQLRGQLDVRVGTGSSLPFAKDDKFNQAERMFNMGVIDDEELLKTSDWPNWQAVLERVNAKKAQAEQAKMGAAPAPGPGA